MLSFSSNRRWLFNVGFLFHFTQAFSQTDEKPSYAEDGERGEEGEASESNDRVNPGGSSFSGFSFTMSPASTPAKPTRSPKVPVSSDNADDVKNPVVEFKYPEAIVDQKEPLRALHNLCDKNKFQLRYSKSVEGPRNSPIFTYKCTVHALGSLWEGTASGPHNLDSKRNAALVVLNALRQQM